MVRGVKRAPPAVNLPGTVGAAIITAIIASARREYVPPPMPIR